ncbi:Gfo/Idh/MocA family oxidoreductase [Coxiella-like endosymbiont]|uniref:Gfo/Idh/MocA family oxidoreductase n=1 Tax=Coxiella-like endosymbiont TaxID=1592897 RepID=UPI002729DC9A|nr:Gfo/Idh/MocA family oxidoreductase [Coxiella-like endosymbiont]
MNPLKVVVVGAGYWGKNLVRNFAELSVLGGICESNQTLARQFAVQYGTAFLSWKEVLDSPEYHAVAIATPAVHHAKLTREALEAKKDVFVEKPLALKIEDAEKNYQIASKNNRILMVGHLLQYHPAFITLKSLVHEGKLGRLQYLYSNRLNLGKIRREEDILWSFAPHDISMILSLVNEEPILVKTIGGYFLHKSIADVTTTHLEFSSGVQAQVFVSWLHPYKEQKLIVIGSKGMAVFDDTKTWKEKLIHYPHQINWQNGIPLPDKSEANYIPLPEGEPLKQECFHFIECVVTRSQAITDAQEGLRVLKVLNQATNSLKLHYSLSSQFPSVEPENCNDNNAFIHQSAFVDNGAKLGRGTKIWHFSHILGGCQIGENCIIGQNVMIGPDVIIGNRCKIQNNVSLYKGITLADGVFCGPSCVFTNVNNPRAEIERKNEFKETRVERGVMIGANATIICGVQLGAYSFIGAGAVVTKDVKPHALVVGNPAKQIGWMSHAGERLGYDLVCPREGRRYYVTENNFLKEEANEALEISGGTI